MYREKSDRQIALQTRQNIDRYIDEIRTTKMPTKFALQTRQKISTKFARQIYRQNSHDEDVDKVRPANTMQLSTIFNENIV